MPKFKIEFDADNEVQLVMKMEVLIHDATYFNKEHKDSAIELKWLGNRYNINLFKSKEVK